MEEKIRMSSIHTMYDDTESDLSGHSIRKKQKVS